MVRTRSVSCLSRSNASRKVRLSRPISSSRSASGKKPTHDSSEKPELRIRSVARVSAVSGRVSSEIIAIVSSTPMAIVIRPAVEAARIA